MNSYRIAIDPGNGAVKYAQMQNGELKLSRFPSVFTTMFEHNEDSFQYVKQQSINELGETVQEQSSPIILGGMKAINDNSHTNIKYIVSNPKSITDQLKSEYMVQQILAVLCNVVNDKSFKAKNQSEIHFKLVVSTSGGYHSWENLIKSINGVYKISMLKKDYIFNIEVIEMVAEGFGFNKPVNHCLSLPKSPKKKNHPDQGQKIHIMDKDNKYFFLDVGYGTSILSSYTPELGWKYECSPKPFGVVNLYDSFLNNTFISSKSGIVLDVIKLGKIINKWEKTNQFNVVNDKVINNKLKNLFLFELDKFATAILDHYKHYLDFGYDQYGDFDPSEMIKVLCGGGGAILAKYLVGSDWYHMDNSGYANVKGMYNIFNTEDKKQYQVKKSNVVDITNQSQAN